jgi:hypothetical protein
MNLLCVALVQSQSDSETLLSYVYHPDHNTLFCYDDHFTAPQKSNQNNDRKVEVGSLIRQ